MLFGALDSGHLSEGRGLPPLCWTQIVLRRLRWDPAARRGWGRDHIGAGAVLAIHHQLHRVVLAGGHCTVAAGRAEQLLLTGDSRSVSQVQSAEAAVSEFMALLLQATGL